MIAEGLHAECRDTFAFHDGQHFVGEAPEMRIHHIERHLHDVEPEIVLIGALQRERFKINN